MASTTTHLCTSSSRQNAELHQCVIMHSLRVHECVLAQINA
jgi:hypothetical protein